MALEKFKICPACGEHNNSSRFECNKCETDLTGVKIVDEAILQSNQNAPTDDVASSNNNGELVKSCDCGVANPPQSRKCTACGEDISDIRPKLRENKKNKMRYSLHSIDNEFSFSFDKPITIIGREAEMKEYLSAKLYVSRQHSKFTITEGGVFIENIKATNSTFINNLPIPCDVPVLLKEGDEIGMGGKVINGNRQDEAAYFVFMLDS